MNGCFFEQTLYNRNMNTHEILKFICNKHDVSLFELVGPCRRSKLVLARVETVQLLKKERLSSREIAIILGNRNRSTILNLIKLSKTKQYKIK